MKYRTCVYCQVLKPFKSYAQYSVMCSGCRRPVEKAEQRERSKLFKYKLSDPVYVLRSRMRTQVRSRSHKKGGDVEQVLGFSMRRLKSHLEKQFSPGMTWELFVEGQIHIDHVVPISCFSSCADRELVFKHAWSLKNLQPLWSTDNLRKAKKLPNVLPSWYRRHFGKNTAPGRPLRRTTNPS